jgi:Mn2+/Fe2+ NRAMP family transporter
VHVLTWPQDPGNLESDLQTGATAGYSLLWVVLATTFMGEWWSDRLC